MRGGRGVICSQEMGSSALPPHLPRLQCFTAPSCHTSSSFDIVFGAYQGFGYASAIPSSRCFQLQDCCRCSASQFSSTNPCFFKESWHSTKPNPSEHNAPAAAQGQGDMARSLRGSTLQFAKGFGDLKLLHVGSRLNPADCNHQHVPEQLRAAKLPPTHLPGC